MAKRKPNLIDDEQYMTLKDRIERGVLESHFWPHRVAMVRIGKEDFSLHVMGPDREVGQEIPGFPKEFNRFGRRDRTYFLDFIRIRSRGQTRGKAARITRHLLPAVRWLRERGWHVWSLDLEIDAALVADAGRDLVQASSGTVPAEQRFIDL